MGFKIVARANNHVTDWGVEGMRMSDRLLDEAGLAHAGSGDTLAAARAGRFYDTPTTRVALVSMASTFTPNSRAEDPLGEVFGRPGLSALRTKRTYVVPPEKLAQLAAIREGRPYDLMERKPTDTEVDFFGLTFRADPQQSGVGVAFKQDPRDEGQILQAIRQAKQTSDYVIATMHTHEAGNFSEIPDFQRDFARKTIDAGADQFIGHGPHQLRGIEIYKGRPIFYSLANFSFMLNDMRPLTPDFYEMANVERVTGQTQAEYSETFRKKWFAEAYWWESVVVVTKYGKDGALAEIRLYPIELNVNAREMDKGIPRLAAREQGDRILAHLRDLSAPLGTTIQLDNGVGVIRAKTGP
jgi:poly-gamma-glutamate synthesis protein (capsule biosynthesis protein)